ncbi:MAG: hypothetical protein K6T26_00415 [Alicyclobacillus sp.]|nr:hypothetical protein [Alicyclobacillus sp.]
MGKKQKRGHSNTQPEGLDKPAWARGEGSPAERKQPQPSKAAARPGLAQPVVADAPAIPAAERWGKDVTEKLAALKAQMQSATASPAPPADWPGKAANGAAGRPSQSARSIEQTEDEESFAELFNPAEEEDSFADLLAKSKLDWRKFKD